MGNRKSFVVPKDVRQKAHAKYVKYDIVDNLGCGAVIWFTLFCWNLIAGFSMPPFQNEDSAKYKLSHIEAFGQRVRDVFYPVSNGWHPSMISDSNSVFGFRYGYTYNENNKDKFNPRPAWYVNVACLLVFAYWAFGVSRKQSKRKARQKMVDVILKIPFVGCCNPKQVNKLMEIAPEIVSHMSRDRRVYFDTLVNPNEYTDMKADIMHNDAVRAMVIEIMAGHLESHPEDLEKALAVCATNAIPRNMLMENINQKVK